MEVGLGTYLALASVLFTIGVSMTSANHASMILAGLPVFTGAIAMAWDRVVPKRLWWAGCAVALAGEFVLITSQGPGGGAQASVAGDLVVLASNLFASLGYVAGGRLQRAGYPSSGTTFYGAALFALLLAPAVFLVGDGTLIGSGVQMRGSAAATKPPSMASWLVASMFSRMKR